MLDRRGQAEQAASLCGMNIKMRLIGSELTDTVRSAYTDNTIQLYLRLTNRSEENNKEFSIVSQISFQNMMRLSWGWWWCYGWIYFPLSPFLFWVFILSFVECLLRQNLSHIKTLKIGRRMLTVDCLFPFYLSYLVCGTCRGNLLSHWVQTPPPPLPLPWSQPNINLIRIRNGSAFSKAVTKFIPTNILPFVWLSSYIYNPPAGNPIRRILRKVNGETVKKLNDVQINLIHHLFHFSCFC